MFCRAGGNFYTRDKITGHSESLETADRAVAKQLLTARKAPAFGTLCRVRRTMDATWDELLGGC